MAEVNNWSCFAVIPVLTQGGENKILLVQDQPVSGRKIFHKLPGGRKESNENSPRETIEREIPEELGDKIDIRIKDKIFKELVEDKPNKPHLFYGFVAEPITEDEVDKVEMGGELCNVECLPISKVERMISYSEVYPLRKGMLPRHAKVVTTFIRQNEDICHPVMEGIR